MNRSGRTKEQVIPFHPSGDFFYKKGMNWYQKGDLDRARKYMSRALKEKPNDVEYLCQQAAILSELEYYQSSIDLLKKVVYELDSQMTDCYFFMANNYAYLGEFSAALEEIQHYITMDPHGAFADEARELFDLLTEDEEDADQPDQEPDYVRLHERGRVALENGRFDQAVRLFRKITEDEPDYLAAQNNLTIAYFSMGQTEEALQAAQTVLARDPGNIHTLCNLAAHFHESKNEEQLKHVLASLDTLHPFNREYCGKMGSTYLFIGENRKASYWLAQAEKRGVVPDQVFRFWQALAAFRLGDEPAARKYWEQVDYFSDKPFDPLRYAKIQDMFFDADAKKNFMVHDLLLRELHAEEPSYPIFTVFYLANREEWEMLAEQAASSAHPLVRALSSRLIQEKETAQPDEGFELMRWLERFFSGQSELLKRPELFHFWKIIDGQLINPQGDNDCRGWAAALVYLWRKEYGTGGSQVKVAEETGTTVYRIRKHVYELSEILNQKQD